jgi:hypothetical protein
VDTAAAALVSLDEDPIEGNEEQPNSIVLKSRRLKKLADRRKQAILGEDRIDRLLKHR